MQSRSKELLLAVSLLGVAALFVWFLRDTMAPLVLALAAVILASPGVVKLDRALSATPPENPGPVSLEPDAGQADRDAQRAVDDPEETPGQDVSTAPTGMRGRAARRRGR